MTTPLKSPFPGMDPFIEAWEWKDFHLSAICHIREQIVLQLDDKTVARIERREYDHDRERFIEIRDAESREVFTVVELLSPRNKREGDEGREKYLRSRKRILTSRTHLVEIDLLRDGLPMPYLSDVPAGDFFALVSRSDGRPQAEVYAWPLKHRIPSIPIPWREGVHDVSLDLQRVADRVYETGYYHLSVDYNWPLTPPLTDDQQLWADELLSSRRQQ